MVHDLKLSPGIVRLGAAGLTLVAYGLKVPVCQGVVRQCLLRCALFGWVTVADGLLAPVGLGKVRCVSVVDDLPLMGVRYG